MEKCFASAHSMIQQVFSLSEDAQRIYLNFCIVKIFALIPFSCFFVTSMVSNNGKAASLCYVGN